MSGIMTGRGVAPRAITSGVLLAPAGMACSQQSTTYRYQYDAMGSLTQITGPLGLAFFFALVEPACAGATYAPVRVHRENIAEVVLQWEHTVTTPLDTDKNGSAV